MRKLKLTEACQQRFIKALSKTGSVTNAAALAGTSRTRVYELRNRDPGFAAAWEDAEEVAADRLEDEARRRAVEGVPEPLVSGGKLVAVRRGLHQGDANESGGGTGLRCRHVSLASRARSR